MKPRKPAKSLCGRNGNCRLLASIDTIEKETQKEQMGDGMSIRAMTTITAAVTMMH